MLQHQPKPLHMPYPHLRTTRIRWIFKFLCIHDMYYIYTNKFIFRKHLVDKIHIEKCFACSMHYSKAIPVPTIQYFIQETSDTCHPFLHDMFGIWRHFSGQTTEMFESIRGVFPRPEKWRSANSAQSFASSRRYISIKELNKGCICRKKVFLFEVIFLLKNIKCILRLVGSHLDSR